MNIRFPRFAALPMLLLFISSAATRAQQIQPDWKPRKDLNILLPASVRVYEASGNLADGAPFRAVYATVDLRDENLKLRAIGSNTIRETTEETAERHNGILAINGGYFSGSNSVSLLVSDGEVISPGLTHKANRGAFAMIEGEPEIFWTRSENKEAEPLVYQRATSKKGGIALEANLAVGAGPVIIQNGKIKVTGKEEGFGGSHLLRHPRSAVGYANEHSIILMVVDGRQKASAGVTLPELAQLMKSVGAVEAMNLDGGGSSAMVAAEEVVNIPVDIPNGNRNRLRNNASALVLSEILPSEEHEIYYFDTADDNYREVGLWKTSNLVNYYAGTPSRTASAEGEINKAFFSFNGIPGKQYQLASWWPVNKENSERLAYVLHQNDVTDTIYVNQADLSTSGKWNLLGNFHLGPKDSLEILGTGTAGKMKTDAIRLVALNNTPELPVRGDLRIAVISDLNSGLGAADYEWQVDSIINRIPRIWKPDLVICGGDMVAGMGISDTAQLRKMWKGFEEHIAEPLREAGIPFAFTLGNHDGPRSYPLEQKMAREYWKQPGHAPGIEFVDREFFPNYYSFVQDDVFFVSWEASSAKITEANLEWMEEQFNSPEAKNAKLRFVMGHMPLYSVAQERNSKGNVLAEPEKLQQLLEDYNVHTYISGHQHAYYPGKRGDLEFLNTGAAGSGPRGWLTLEDSPVNTISILDVFHQEDSIAYTTYEIKEKDAGKMQLFEKERLPSAMFGVNGYVLRRDVSLAKKATGLFSALHVPGKNKETGSGFVTAEIKDGKILISGNYSGLQEKLLKENPISLYLGRNTEEGEFLISLKPRSRNKKRGRFKGKLDADTDLMEYLSVGALYTSIKTGIGELRAQLYPKINEAPTAPKITSHPEKNIYAVRDLEALYEIEWAPGLDEDGDFISYTYQLSEDPEFKELVFQEKTGRSANLKRTERFWYHLLKDAPVGTPVKFYQRILASDGKNVTPSPVTEFKLMKTNEPLDDLVEVPAPAYEFAGKIENAHGAGYGAEWDHEGKLWLADYRGTLSIRKKDGTEAAFSPLRSVRVNGKEYNLNPINGIGVDLDGNILVGRNRHLLKIDASTGEGIAVWEVPEGERAITSPRVNSKGEIYAMSLFADDPNYVLRQSEKNPSTFELLRTIGLKDRILSRTFDMSPDGMTLYFPDPGSPLIQKYSSTDGKKYVREEDINSTASGSSAIQVTEDNQIYAAVRASGILPSTFHFRDEKNQKMWTLELPEVGGAEPRGIGVSPDQKVLIFCSYDKGGFYKYVLKE